jgi:DNA-binding CsgD family transcriptional regulator
MTELQKKLISRHSLTPRQAEVAELTSRGLINRVIATRLGVTEKAIKYHLGLVFKKCGIRSRGELTHVIDKITKGKR